MNAQMLALLNTAVTHRNLARHRVLNAMIEGNTRLHDAQVRLMIGWESRARFLASQLGTKLVAMPGAAGALIAEVFVGMLPIE